jgi:hypothetical protein
LPPCRAGDIIELAGPSPPTAIIDSTAYDFFIAHAGPDREAAERLFELLIQQANVFLDTRSLELGDRWGVVLSEAQRQSRITVVIVSPHTDDSFYQQEEVAAAIDLARRESHRVVPVFLEGALDESTSIPYGLRSLHYAELSEQFTYEELARRLLALIGIEPESAPPGSDAPRPTTAPAATAARVRGAAASALAHLRGVRNAPPGDSKEYRDEKHYLGEDLKELIQAAAEAGREFDEALRVSLEIQGAVVSGGERYVDEYIAKLEGIVLPDS